MKSQIFVFTSISLATLAGCQHGKDHHKHHDKGSATAAMSGHDNDEDDDDDVETSGKVLKLADVPAAAVAGFKRDYPGVKIVEIEEEIEGSETHYEFEYLDAAGKEQEVEYAADGTKAHDH